MITNLVFHPHGAYDVNHAVDVGPGVRLVGRGKVYRAGALKWKEIKSCNPVSGYAFSIMHKLTA